MSDDRSSPYTTLALNTKVEEDFIAPLTAVRGALEILRDTPDLDVAEQQRFLDTALRGCAKLGTSIQELAATVYDAGRRNSPNKSINLPEATYREYVSRVHTLDEYETIELDLSDFEFSSAAIVNEFYDVIEELVAASGRDWYFLVNYRDCRIWPEAWIAFAHRGKKINAICSLGTVRYAESVSAGDENLGSRFDPDLFPSRDAALERIQALKAAR